MILKFISKHIMRLKKYVVSPIQNFFFEMSVWKSICFGKISFQNRLSRFHRK